MSILKFYEKRFKMMNNKVTNYSIVMKKTKKRRKEKTGEVLTIDQLKKVRNRKKKSLIIFADNSKLNNLIKLCLENKSFYCDQEMKLMLRKLLEPVEKRLDVIENVSGFFNIIFYFEGKNSCILIHKIRIFPNVSVNKIAFL